MFTRNGSYAAIVLTLTLTLALLGCKDSPTAPAGRNLPTIFGHVVLMNLRQHLMHSLAC